MMGSGEVEVVILCGGISSEREVSLRSGRRVFDLLQPHIPTRLIILESNGLPGGLDANRHLIFPLIHGEFGEDGRLQRLLEKRDFIFLGSDAESAVLTMDKGRTKDLVRDHGIGVLPQVRFSAAEKSTMNFSHLVERLSSMILFLKPNGRGSSLFCARIDGEDQLSRALQVPGIDEWLCEPYCPGRDLTVGILHGHALEVLEIVPTGMFVDYDSKYSAGGSRHLVPAPIEKTMTETVRHTAEKIFRLCRCRDWARIDFLLASDGRLHFLEVNSIPGFTATSFYPDSGRAFAPDRLLLEMLAPALAKFPRA